MAIDQSDPRMCGLAWAAKVIGSGVFITGREPWDVVRQSCNWMIATDAEIRAVIEGRGHLDLGERLVIDVDAGRRAVTLTLDGEISAAARHFGGQGCIIVPDAGSGVQFAPTPVKPDVPDPEATAWPRGDALADDPAATGIDLGRVDAALDLMFENARQHTNAMLVVHKGVLVRERYREPFDRSSRFESWSMGKSIAASLAGILLRRELIDLEAPLPFEEWSSPGDARARIRTRDLLHMSSGLEFTGSQGMDEDPLVKTRDGRFLDHIYVYAGAVDAFDFSARKPAEFRPDTVGRYRNCDPLLLTRLVRDSVRARGEDFLTWPQRNLFDPLGMAGMVLETDPWGGFLISGHDYGRPRDWARLGVLYLQRGAWGGEQILPESFVEFVQTPAPAFEEPCYGGFFWLNRSRRMPTLPEDAYWMAGAGGQRVVIVPGLDLVIVRMGHLAGALAGWEQTLDRASALLVEAAQPSARRR
jgi:CubicO group peptidase (beta-lactamase class C family)